jgi:hypothetical protein
MYNEKDTSEAASCSTFTDVPTNCFKASIHDSSSTCNNKFFRIPRVEAISAALSAAYLASVEKSVAVRMDWICTISKPPSISYPLQSFGEGYPGIKLLGIIDEGVGYPTSIPVQILFRNSIAN